MKRFVFGAALAVLASHAGFAQTPAAPATAAPQKPAAPAPAPAQPAPPAAVPRPFPEGAKVAFVILQRIASESAEGKSLAAKLQALQQKKSAELGEKQKQIQGLQAKLEKEATVMSSTAQADMQKQIERLQVDLQRATQDAQQEMQELQNQLQEQFEAKIEPVITEVGKEKGLHFILNYPQAGFVYADPGLDLTDEVIKKLDSGKPVK